jgi:hypothetical protein
MPELQEARRGTGVSGVRTHRRFSSFADAELLEVIKKSIEIRETRPKR